MSNVCGRAVPSSRRLMTYSCHHKFHIDTLSRKEFKLHSRPPSDKTRDFIGPPDPSSNLRPIIFRSRPLTSDLSPEELKYHEKYEKVMKWNQDFWSKHNKNFSKRKEEYIEEKLKSKTGLDAEKGTLTAEEMSTFYKQFLDENYRLHTQYNIDWYKKNISLLWPAMQVAVTRMFKKLKR